MTMTKPTIELLNISSELKKLWDAKQGENKIRASLFTFILYVEKGERLSYYQNLVKTVISKLPCRVIFIQVDEKGEALKSCVTSETMGEGAKQIYCEKIEINVGEKLLPRIPSLILPHLLPDLPVYLLWTKDPAAQSSLLRLIEPIAERILFDADSTEDLQSYARSVLSSLTQFHCQIGDLNWSATSGWREVIEQVFNSPEAFSSLRETKRIRIHYNKKIGSGSQHSEIKAAYLQAWIASRLNWKFQTIELIEGNVRLSYRKPSRDVVVLLQSEEVSTLPPGAILSIEIESSQEEEHYNFKRHPETSQAFIQYSTAKQCDLPYSLPLAHIKEGEEIVKEVFNPSTGVHYREMLEVISEIPWRNAP
ncbi:MAG: hypothetical protein K940chlam9_00470 [Chlamydiae bacterium]|nr:hypothetical protein [Chlamydiota bacterium]